MDLMRRLASAPISWGVCEVPGWGVELPRERVLGEMRDLGLQATELGSGGYIPTEPDALRSLVGNYELQMIGGFVPVVIHDPSQRQATIDATHRAAQLMSGAGGHLFISSAVTDWDWGPRPELGAAAWRHAAEMLGVIDEILTEYSMVQALHPHLRTIVETRDDIARILDLSEVGWTIDTGHMVIGGMDPLEFARQAFDRIRHVHLKDVRHDLASAVFAGDRSIMEGVQAGMFCNLGQGDVHIAEIVRTYESLGYDQWYVLEQDAAITTGQPEVGRGPVLDVQASIEYLREVEGSASAA
ncbi:MAG: TIM barrel protein [Acidimicrobiia bacterium]|nr:TIM barrel protein [Acidimicrobiia bacterium]